MYNPELRASLFCAPMLLGSCAGISSYAPSLDVYGSYFPAWLICLMVGVILTIGVRLIGVFNLGIVRMLVHRVKRKGHRSPGMAVEIFVGMYLFRILSIGPVGFILAFIVSVLQSIGSPAASQRLLRHWPRRARSVC
jgi:YtcA family